MKEELLHFIWQSKTLLKQNLRTVEGEDLQIIHPGTLNSDAGPDFFNAKIKIGDTIGKKDFTFAGTDEERLKDLQQMLNDPKVKAIMCARGGYGAVRIIDKLKWEKFKAKPKWIIGFSDIT
ncbi:MAG: DUF2851 family protein, partial [Bacteroidia bacterium]